MVCGGGGGGWLMMMSTSMGAVRLSGFSKKKEHIKKLLRAITVRWGFLEKVYLYLVKEETSSAFWESTSYASSSESLIEFFL